jgi:hypothetical protein
MLLISLGEHFLLASGKPLADYRNLFSKPPLKAHKITPLTASTDFMINLIKSFIPFMYRMPLL